jgi:glycosyltransferase involved in cell wall biosynthesis
VISIVIPCFNEERRIGASLETMLRFLRGSGLDWEIVAVDDGSRDATSAAIQRAADGDGRVRLVRHDVNRGKGEAVRSGFRSSQGEWVL